MCVKLLPSIGLQALLSITAQQVLYYFSRLQSKNLQKDMSSEDSSAKRDQKEVEGAGSEKETASQDSPISPSGSVECVSSNEEDEVVEKGGRKSGASSDQEEPIPIPPPVPKNGMTILSHKLWIGNLDKRLTE